MARNRRRAPRPIRALLKLCEISARYDHATRKWRLSCNQTVAFSESHNLGREVQPWRDAISLIMEARKTALRKPTPEQLFGVTAGRYSSSCYFPGPQAHQWWADEIKGIKTALEQHLKNNEVAEWAIKSYPEIFDPEEPAP